MSTDAPDAFDLNQQQNPAATQPAASVATIEPIKPVVIAEPEDSYQQQMRTVFEQVVSTESKDGYVVENGCYVNFVPVGEESVIRRMAKKGWKLDTAYRPTPGMSQYMKLKIPIEKKDAMDREAARRTAESQGIRLKDDVPIKDLASNDLQFNESKFANEILHNLPDSASDLDES